MVSMSNGYPDRTPERVAIEQLGLLIAKCDGFVDGLRDTHQHDIAVILADALKEPRQAYEAARTGAKKTTTPA